jgi:prepilin-type N-terminal cleavage/methylation domain-containing protein
MNKGFTLIELILVIVILGIISIFAIPKYVSLQSESELSVAKGFGATLKEAASLYVSRMATRGWPDPQPNSFNSFVGFTEDASDLNMIHIDKSIKSLLKNPAKRLDSHNMTVITFEFKGGGTATYTIDPATGAITDEYKDF